MNEEIEQRVERLRPADPSAEFMQRLLAADPGPRLGDGTAKRGSNIVARKRWSWWAACAASAAALVAFAAIRYQPDVPPVVSQDESHIYEPAEMSSTLVEASDMGVLAVDPAQPYRMIRCMWLDEELYDRNDGNSSMRTFRAREQIIPVAMPIY